MTPLERALTELGDPPVRRLPADVESLMYEFSSPPRLAAHLRLVHDVAVQVLDVIERLHPNIDIDAAAVRYGAAIHDIGKVRFPVELSEPGSLHEQAGYELLVANGVEPASARFARTHACWSASGVTIEDLLVSLADKVWKAKRIPDLEQLLMQRLADADHRPVWEVFLPLDDELTRIADGADARLAFQAAYPATV